MKRALDKFDYLRNPVGQFVQGRSWARFCLKSDLVGGVFWGHVGDEDLRAYLGLALDELQNGAVPCATYIDARRLESVEASSLATLKAFYQEHAERLRPTVTKVAGVRPVGFAGAVLGGLTQVQAFPYPTSFFATPQEALAFLGISDPDEEGVLDALLDQVCGLSDAVRNLRSLLDANPRGRTVESTAREMGMSSRSLQRRLQDADTSFLRELNEAQLRIARRLLADTDAGLLSIGLEIGCGTAAHFSVWFRNLTGEPPSHFRSRRRGGG